MCVILIVRLFARTILALISLLPHLKCDDVVRNTNLPLNQFNVDFDRSKEMLSALAKIRDNYISSSSKVRAMKQTSKQDLSKIQKVEGERNAIAKYYDKLADEASAEIDRIVDRAKIDALEQVRSDRFAFSPLAHAFLALDTKADRGADTISPIVLGGAQWFPE